MGNSMTDNRSVFVPVAIVSAAYIAAQMMSDVASLRIVTILGFSMDAGTLIYPFTFTLRDMVHKVAGIKVARALILTAAGVNLLMALLFWGVAKMPADMAVGPQLEFGVVLAPVWRIVMASIVAEVAAEFIDGEVYQRWVNRFKQRMQWMRVLVSNGISVPIDSALFCGLAFVGRMEFGVVVSIFVANLVLKGIVTLVSLPLIYLVKERNTQA